MPLREEFATAAKLPQRRTAPKVPTSHKSRSWCAWFGTKRSLVQIQSARLLRHLQTITCDAITLSRSSLRQAFGQGILSLSPHYPVDPDQTATPNRPAASPALNLIATRTRCRCAFPNGSSEPLFRADTVDDARVMNSPNRPATDRPWPRCSGRATRWSAWAKIKRSISIEPGIETLQIRTAYSPRAACGRSYRRIPSCAWPRSRKS